MAVLQLPAQSTRLRQVLSLCPEHKRHWEPAEPTAIVTIHCSDSIPGRGSQTMFGPALFKARTKCKDRRKKVEMNANEKDSSKPF